MSLLDDVSIVVTPNGYKAGELYAVVPVPTEGAELVTNGDFSTDANWTKNSGWTISGGSANCDGTQTGNSGLVQQNGIAGVSLDLQIGKQYKMVIDVTVISGAITYIEVASDYQNDDINATGVSTLYFSPTSTNDRITIAANSTFVGSVNSVSVKEYTAADMDVTRATAATRVDENGLVNYAEIVGSEEVDVSSGSPVVPSDWTSATVDSVHFLGSTSGASYYEDVAIGMISGKTYSLKLTVSGYVGTSNTGFSSQGGTGSLGGVPTLTGDGIVNILFVSDGANLRLFSRNSITNVVFSNISVKEVTRDNVPRIDYTGGGCPHILAEPQRTNLITYSSDFSGWSIDSNVTLSLNSATSPDGTVSADNISYVGSVGSPNGKQIQSSITIGGGTANKDFSYSVYIKGTGEFRLKNTHGGVVDSFSSNFTATSDWVRYDFSVSNSSSAGNGTQILGILAASTDSAFNLDIWGAQLEEGSYATSYIPTSGSTVTRNQDQFTRDGISSLINSTEGVLFLEIAALSNDLTTRIISLSDGTNTNRIHCFYYSVSNTIGLNYRVAGSTVASITASLGDETDFKKIAFRWESGNFKLYVDGVSMGTDTNTTMLTANTLSELAFNQGGGASNFFGKVKQLQVYKTALTDEQLIQLTGESGTDFYESYAEMASALTYTIQ